MIPPPTRSRRSLSSCPVLAPALDARAHARHRRPACRRCTRRPAACSWRRCSTSIACEAISFTKGCYTGQEIIARVALPRPHQAPHAALPDRCARRARARAGRDARAMGARRRSSMPCSARMAAANFWRSRPSRCRRRDRARCRTGERRRRPGTPVVQPAAPPLRVARVIMPIGLLERALGARRDRLPPDAGQRGLARLLAATAAATAAQVLVPLCGKSEDMAWLRAQGHTVVGRRTGGTCGRGVLRRTRDCSRHAERRGALQRWRAEGYELYVGDFFDLQRRAARATCRPSTTAARSSRCPRRCASATRAPRGAPAGRMPHAAADGGLPAGTDARPAFRGEPMRRFAHSMAASSRSSRLASRDILELGTTLPAARPAKP